MGTKCIANEVCYLDSTPVYGLEDPDPTENVETSCDDAFPGDEGELGTAPRQERLGPSLDQNSAGTCVRGAFFQVSSGAGTDVSLMLPSWFERSMEWER